AFVGIPIVGVQCSPVAGLMAPDCLEDVLAGQSGQCIGRRDDAAKLELGDNAASERQPFSGLRMIAPRFPALPRRAVAVGLATLTASGHGLFKACVCALAALALGVCADKQKRAAGEMVAGLMN